MSKDIIKSLVLILGLGLTQAEAQQFPYVAYITAEDVYARSGPGQNYYPTDKLARASAVEVYRHDPGGWYAIRPPQNSFSWVAGQYLQVDQQGVGRVLADKVAARVGTSLGDHRAVIQVQLDRGEEVQVLEAKVFGSGAGAQTWYRIAPPSGEFRWVFGSFVTPEPPQDPVRARDASRNRLTRNTPEVLPAEVEQAQPIETEPPTKAAWNITQRQPEPEYVEPAAPRTASSRRLPPEFLPPSEDSLRRADYETPAPAQRPSWRERVAHDEEREAEDVRQVGYQAERTVTREVPRQEEFRPAPPRETRRETRENGELSPEREVDQAGSEEQHAWLDELDAELSRTVAQPTGVWNFTRISLEAEQVYQEATTSIVQMRARRMLEQIDRFDDIRQRHMALGREGIEDTRGVYQVSAEVAQPNVAQPNGANVPNYREAVPVTPQANLDRFDGAGKLTPVVSQRIGAPRYALLDEAGQVNCYVTPAPGVSLRRFMGQRVGIQGTRGYVPELNSPHLSARRIVLLDGDASLR